MDCVDEALEELAKALAAVLPEPQSDRIANAIDTLISAWIASIPTTL